VCPGGYVCQAGQCQPGAAPDGGVMCGGSMIQCTDPTGKPICIDPNYDRNNCGVCGRVCGANLNCMNGACVQSPPPPDGGVTCNSPLVQCTDPTGKPYCTDLTSDPGNCGVCGRMCPGGYTCYQRQCMPFQQPDGGVSCGAPMVQCPGIAGGQPYCSDLSNDPGNCGGCGKPCGAGQACVNGTCATALNCTPPTKACDNSYCADFATDRTNCGGCHKACAATDFCNQGSCQPG
jgi:hypothetical protein